MSWQQFSGTVKSVKVCCWWTTSHSRLQWLDNIMDKNLEICVRQSRTNDEECWLKGPLLLHDNPPVHMAQVVQAVEKDIEFEQLSHPPYSTELAPSDFYLFRHLRRHLCGTRICDYNEIKQATESYPDSMPQKFHLTGIKELFGRSYVANVLLLRAFVLKNNINILLVSYVHYIELQNVLIVPRIGTITTTDIKLSFYRDNPARQNS